MFVEENCSCMYKLDVRLFITTCLVRTWCIRMYVCLVGIIMHFTCLGLAYIHIRMTTMSTST